MGAINSMFSAKAAKAYVASIIAAISTATVAAPDGFTSTEILTILGAFFVTFQATFWTTNAKTYGGIIDVIQPVNPGDKKTYSLNLNSDPADLDQKNEVLFKINA
jgi:hypothetical protein